MNILCTIIGHNIWPQQLHNHYPKGKHDPNYYKVCQRCQNCVVMS